ncbi:MAG: tRNA (adenosine(37)-N6)-dimethylallyltransferase MiaA [Verrucomicrobia bacterium]|nr:tRNA (adenosine(37)-N6)-dimethylallyltransferase MiaA [Verrucomicrobiota bacterium]
MDGAGPVYLVGPTGVGKTATALALAERLPIEIVSADSMQVYRELDILSAKPTADDRARVPHHLIDILDVTEPFSAAEFRRLAEAAIVSIERRGKRALVVGGTGLYIRALADGLFDGPDASRDVRQRLLDEAEAKGTDHLHARLTEVDPAAAGKIARHDLRRIVRALEVYETTGRPISAQQTEWAEPKACLMLGLRLPRATLYARINARVDAMFEAGAVEEVERLVAAGIQQGSTAMQAIGVREITAYLRGDTTLDEAKRRIKTQTRRYAKRQLTWFRKDPRIVWYDVADDGGHVAALAKVLAG